MTIKYFYVKIVLRVKLIINVKQGFKYMPIHGIATHKTLSESAGSLNDSVAMLITSQKDTAIVTNSNSTNDEKISATAEVVHLLDIFSNLRSIPNANTTTTDLIAKFSAFMKTQMVMVPSIHDSSNLIPLQDSSGNAISLYDYAIAGSDATFQIVDNFKSDKMNKPEYYANVPWLTNRQKICDDFKNVDWREWPGKVTDSPTETDASGISWHLRHTAHCSDTDDNEFKASGSKDAWKSSISCVATADAQGKAEDIQTFLAENMPQ
jgi:hypothetical protein